MAGHHVSANRAGGSPTARYLTDLAALLHGPRRARAAILAEIRDGLEQAVVDNTAQGVPASQAAAAVIRQFGTPQAVAYAFAGELATAYARRTIAAFILTGPAVGVWWLLLLHPGPWRSGPAALLAAIPAIPLIALAIAIAFGTFATTGRLIRWLPEATPARALTATTATAVLCLVADTAVLLLLATGKGPHPLPTALAAAAVTASLVRTGCGIRTLQHAARQRRYLDGAASRQK